MKEVLRRSVCEKGEVLWRRGDREREAGWESLREDDRYAWGQGIGIEWREEGPRDSVGTSQGGDEEGGRSTLQQGFLSRPRRRLLTFHYVTRRAAHLASSPPDACPPISRLPYTARWSESELLLFGQRSANTLYKTNTRRKQSKKQYVVFSSCTCVCFHSVLPHPLLIECFFVHLFYSHALLISFMFFCCCWFWFFVTHWHYFLFCYICVHYCFVT